MRRTLAIRFCSWCDGFLGVALWPWTPSAGWFALTHGQCDGCMAKRAAEADALELLEMHAQETR